MGHVHSEGWGIVVDVDRVRRYEARGTWAAGGLGM